MLKSGITDEKRIITVNPVWKVRNSRQNNLRNLIPMFTLIRT